jgi:hypothetical protein
MNGWAYMNNQWVSNLEKKVVKAAFWVLFTNTVIESFLLYFEDRFTLIVIQLILNFGFFIFLYFKKFRIHFSKDFIPPCLLVLLFWVMSIFSSDLLLSFNMLLKFSIPFAFLFIGYSFRSSYLINYLINYIWVFMAYYVCYFLIANYFDIGYEMYLGGVKTGFYTLNGLYIPIFALIIVSFFYPWIAKGKHKLFTIIFSVFTVAVSLSILKRTLLLILLLGLVAIFIYNFNFKFLLKISFMLLFSGLLFFRYFYSDFEKSFESRESRFNKEYNISQEGRFTEYFQIYGLMKEDPFKLFIGSKEVFNDRKYISYTIYDDRELHSSYARVFWNAGTLGLGLFLLFYWIQIKRMLHSFNFFKNKSKKTKLLFYFGLTFIFLRFVSDFSSGITYLGFNSFSYLIIGNLFCLSKNLKYVFIKYVNTLNSKPQVVHN